MKFSIVFLICMAMLCGAAMANNNLSNNNVPSRMTDNQRKVRQELDNKEISSFLKGRNLIKTVIKLLFGNNEESAATSRQVLSVLVKVLDLLRNSFTQKARSSQNPIKATIDEISSACLSVASGVVKSQLTNNTQCVERIMCDAAKEGTSSGKELSSLAVQASSYMASHFLQSQKGIQAEKIQEAVRKGKNQLEDCEKYVCSSGIGGTSH